MKASEGLTDRQQEALFVFAFPRYVEFIDSKEKLRDIVTDIGSIYRNGGPGAGRIFSDQSQEYMFGNNFKKYGPGVLKIAASTGAGAADLFSFVFKNQLLKLENMLGLKNYDEMWPYIVEIGVLSGPKVNESFEALNRFMENWGNGVDYTRLLPEFAKRLKAEGLRPKKLFFHYLMFFRDIYPGVTPTVEQIIEGLDSIDTSA